MPVLVTRRLAADMIFLLLLLCNQFLQLLNEPELQVLSVYK